MSMLTGFKNFLMQGNLVVMAVGLSIALAFSTLVSAFTGSVITPLVDAAGGGGTDGLGFRVKGQLVDIGSFVSAVDLLRRLHGRRLLRDRRAVPDLPRRRGVAVFTEPAPTKACPACLSGDLPLEATKCRYCGTDLTPGESGSLAEPA